MTGHAALGRLKRFVGRSEDSSPYVCRSCESRHDVQYHVCPDCGGYAVERLDFSSDPAR